MLKKCSKTMLEKLLSSAKGEVVKKNKKRTVYKVDGFYIKHDHPKEWFHRIKSLFWPKSKKEFNSGLCLKEAGISTIPVIKWERKRFESYLITKEISGAFLLKDLLSDFNIPPQDMNIFLTCFEQFLNSLVEKKVYHPDLHSGNILVKKEGNNYCFYLVDLYGIKIKKELSKKDLFRLFGWLVTVLWPLEEQRIQDFLVNSGFCSRKEVQKKWLELVRFRISYIRSRCKKRRKKLFKDSSICKSFYLPDMTVLIKDSGSEKRLCKFAIKSLSEKDALRCWENSYFLPLFGIPVLSHFLLIKTKHTSFIAMEIPERLTPLKNKNKAEVAFAIERFNLWLSMAGIKAEISFDDIFVSENSIFPLVFSNPERFYLKL